MDDKIAIIGAGRMGSAMVRELVHENSDFYREIIVSDRNIRKLKGLSCFNIKTSGEKQVVIEQARILILAVRPQQMKMLISEIAEYIQPYHIIISIAIGVPLKWFADLLPKNHNIFHIHPPSTIMTYSKGVSFFCFLPNIKDTIIKEVELLFSNFGEIVHVEEKNIGTYAIFAGCSPAFFCDFLEKWKKMALSFGIEEQIAILVINKMFEAIWQGTVQNKLQYSDIIDNIATPQGVTLEGLKRIEPLMKLFSNVYDAGINKINSIKNTFN